MRFKYAAIALGLAAGLSAEEQPPVEVTVTLRAISLAGPILGHGYRKAGKIAPLVIAPDFFTQEFIYRGVPHFEILPLTAAVDPTEIAKLAKRPTSKPSELSIKTPFAEHTIAKPGGPAKSLLAVGPDPRKSADPRQSAGPTTSADPQRSLDPIRSADPVVTANAQATTGPRQTVDPIRSDSPLKSMDAIQTAIAQKTIDPEEIRRKRQAAFIPVSIEPAKKLEKGAENKALAWIDLPTTPGPHHLILLINPGDPKGGIMAIDDAPGAFQYGTIRFYNFCSYPVEIRVPGSRTKIHSRGSLVVRPTAADATYFEGSIHSLSTAEDNESLTYSFRYFQQYDLRTLYFIIPSPEADGQVLIKGVEDRYRPPLPAGGK